MQINTKICFISHLIQISILKFFQFPDFSGYGFPKLFLSYKHYPGNYEQLNTKKSEPNRVQPFSKLMNDYIHFSHRFYDMIFHNIFIQFTHYIRFIDESIYFKHIFLRRTSSNYIFIQNELFCSYFFYLRLQFINNFGAFRLKLHNKYYMLFPRNINQCIKVSLFEHESHQQQTN